MEQRAIPRNPIAFARFCSVPYRGWAMAACTAVLAAMVLSRTQVYLVKVITDSVVAFGQGSVEMKEVWFWLLVFPALYIVNESIWRVSGFCGMRWITGATAEAYRQLFSYLTGHSADYFGDRFAGALTNKISNAANGTQELIAQCLWQFSTLALALIGDVYLTSLAHPYLAAILAFWSVSYIAINMYFVSRLHTLTYALAKSASKLKGKIVDSTSNIETVQQSAGRSYERDYVGNYVGKYQSAHLKEWWISEWVLVADGLLLALFILSMFSCGAWLVQTNQLEVGSLVMMITVVITLEYRFFFLGQQMTKAVEHYGNISEGLEELLKPHTVVSKKDAEVLKVQDGTIEFDSVSFSYREQRVFKDFSLHIPGGQKVGIVGPSGAGKSTLVKLLLRQYDVQEGEIRVDRKRLKDVDLESLRRQTALVPQTTALFHRSIIDNIRYGRLDASDEEVLEAAKLAQADEFIQQLPRQYETFVGERGVKLSGGQRQRIAIARAILKRSPILILDEATSSLDSESEEEIQTALAQVMKGKTVVAIAHRLSTLQAMDRIIVIQNGALIEDGSHTELLEQDGLYASLWKNQVRGFIQDELLEGNASPLRSA